MQFPHDTGADARGLSVVTEERSARLTALRRFCPPLGWQADLIGLPYDFHGYSRAGVSCWGLGCLAWKEQADVCVPTFEASLPNDPQFSTARVRAVNALVAEGVKVMRQIKSPRPMCFVQMRRGTNLTHIGLYAFGGWLVHADEEANGGHGAVVQTPLRDMQAAITGFYWPADPIFEAGMTS